MATLFGRSMPRSEIEAHCGNLTQIGGVALATLADGAERGVRTLIFRTGSGLEFSVLIDRAFDIASCRYRGVELGWQSPVGIRAPWFHEVNDEGGASFNRSFSGFLVTCGLDHTGPQHRESASRYLSPDRATIDQPLHGRISASPAQLVAYGHEWRGDRCILFAEGSVKQVAVFGEHLVLTRRYEAEIGTSTFTIHDRVRNHSFFDTPHMLLYHLNCGFPLLDAGSEFLAPIRGVRWAARDTRPERLGYRFQESPRIGFSEQVYVHDAIADADGRTRAALVNRRLEGGAGLAVAIEFSRAQLPYLMQWQNFQAGSYCMAIEPATCHALGRAHAESQRELRVLKNGDEHYYDLRVSVLDGPEQLGAFETLIRNLAPDPPDPFAAPREGFGV